MADSKKRQLALIGAGYWGKNLARNFNDLGVLHTICDRDEPLLERYRSQYADVLTTTDSQKVFSNDEIKQVVIAAPAFQHYQLAKQALLSGKDVYVEKPLCLDVKEAEELVALAKEKKLILMVGHLLHYHACVRKLQELVGTGEIGKVQYISSNRLNLGSYRTEENSLWNFAPHDISVILSLCGNQLPEKVRCMGEDYLSDGVEDITLTTLRFSGNVRAHIYVSWLNPFKEQKLTVIGSKAMVVFDDTKPWGEKLLLYRDHVTWTDGKVPLANQVIPEKIDPPQVEPLREECLHFLNCCEERLIPRTDGEEGLRVLQVLQAAEISMKEDGEVVDPKQQKTNSEEQNVFIHPTAAIDPGADVGEGVKIWHFSHIMGKAKVGNACKIGQNVFIGDGVVLGDNVKVQNNISIYSGVICEDDVFLGPSMVFTNIVNPRSLIVRRDQYTQTLVKKGATIGANATIICGVTLGEYSFVGAGAVVTKDILPFALVMGNPARQTGWISRHGERLDLPVSILEGRQMTAKCPVSKEVYCLEGNRLHFVQSPRRMAVR